MLKIVNEAGRVLDLADDIVITVEKLNPLFNDSDDNDFYQDFSYPGQAPLSESNKIFFNFAHLVETPGKSYNFPVQVFADEVPILFGNINGRIGTGNSNMEVFEFNLEPNFAALNALISDINMSDIPTYDAFSIANDDDMKALMLDSVLYPKNHPFIFMPVYNPGQSGVLPDGEKDHFIPFINNFDQATQAFIPFNASKPFGTYNGQTPFFRLAYILQQLSQYLGLTASGSFLTNSDTSNIVVYSRISHFTLSPEYNTPCRFYPSMRYMPNMLITDFIKQLRKRLHLVDDIDMAAGVATFETLDTIISSDEAVDISDYISGDAIEQETNDDNGYTITLKSDEKDAAFKVTEGDQDTYPAIYKLVAGDGKTTEELECGTTKTVDNSTADTPGARYPWTDQGIINGARNFFTGLNSFIPQDIDSYGYLDPRPVNNWPLRLMKYEGWKELSAGKYYPCGSALDLDIKDVFYYRFLNDAKDLIVTANFPPAVLAQLNITKKICFRTRGRNYTEVIITKLAYDLSRDSESIPTKIYCKSINFDVNTRVEVVPVKAVGTHEHPYPLGYVKAYFDNSITGIAQLNVEIAPVNGNVYTFETIPIIVPTTVKGTGGVIYPIMVPDGVPSDDTPSWNAELRITQGNPKYMEYYGNRYPFTWSDAGGYWYVPVDLTPSRMDGQSFIDAFWIVF